MADQELRPAGRSFRGGMICAIIAIFAGLLAGMVDYYNGSPKPAAFILAVLTGVLGYVHSRRAWLYALLSGPGLFLVLLMNSIFDAAAIEWQRPETYMSLTAFIPAFIGAYWGVLIRWLACKLDKKPRPNPDAPA